MFIFYFSVILSALSLSIYPILSTSSFLNSPRNIKVSHSSDPTLVNILWSPPKEPNGKITGYDILYTDNNLLIDRKWKREKVKGEKTTIILTKLIPDSKYFLKIKARIDGRELGPPSDEIEFITNPYSLHSHTSISSIFEFLTEHLIKNKDFFWTCVNVFGLFGLCILICSLIVFVFLYFFIESKQNKAEQKRAKKNNENSTREGLTI